jgi:hypothetical protein
MLAAIIGYSILFRGAYTPALRHEGVLFFVLVSLCWIAATEPGDTSTPAGRKSLALGMLPLLAFQTLTLPVVARRYIVHPLSSSKLFANLINSSPKYREAILMSEPDYNLETMPYYVTNPVYMPRQREFHYRVYWDRGPRRQQDLSLGQLVNIADSVGCANSRPVLLAITYRQVITDTAGSTRLPYRPAIFRWNQTDRALLMSRSRRVMSFLAAADEDYYIFEFPVRKTPACRTTG